MKQAFTTTCEKVLLQKKLLETLKNEKFDLLITELFDVCAFGALSIVAVNDQLTSPSKNISNFEWQISNFHYSNSLKALTVTFPFNNCLDHQKS